MVGATGGLGRDVVAEAGGDQHQVAALVRNPARATLPAAVELTAGDVLRPASLTAALGGRDAVICVLGTPSPRQPSTLLREGTANLVAAMREGRWVRFIPNAMDGRSFSAVLLARVLTGSELTSWGMTHPTLWKLEHAEQVRAEKLFYKRFASVDPFLMTATTADAAPPLGSPAQRPGAARQRRLCPDHHRRSARLEQRRLPCPLAPSSAARPTAGR